MAQKHYENIVASHADLINALSAQSQKVQVFNQQKDAERQNQAIMDREAAQQNEANGITVQKNNMDYAQTQQKNAADFHTAQSDLAIQRAALNKPTTP